MSERIHVVVDAAEKARFRRMAEKEGKTLSAWLRDAARERLVAAQDDADLGTVEALDTFFEECDGRERGREPDWEEHADVIRRSRATGRTGT